MSKQYIIQCKAKTGGNKYVLSCAPNQFIQYTNSKDMAMPFHNLHHAKRVRDDVLEHYKPATILRIA